MNIFIAVIQGEHALLTPEESWHCAKVLRKKAGDAVSVIDGRGNLYLGTLEFVSEKSCTVKILSGPEKQSVRPYRMHLAIAPTKQIDRMEWMIEKAVEIGIDEISFIQCTNSERVNLKEERLRKIVESAVKQSLQSLIPLIHPLKPFRVFVEGADAGQKLIAHCGPGEKIPVRDLQFRDRSSCILIGPEGDFTGAEVLLATAVGFRAISLGSTRLRTETAGLFAVQAAALLGS